MYPQKPIHTNSFDGGQDTDTADSLFAQNRARYMLNVRPYTNGEKGLITNIKGNVLISVDLPDGENKAIGWGADEESNKFYFFLYNGNGYHTIFMYDGLQNTIVRVLQSKTDSDGIDILRFSKDYRINHVNVVQNNLIYWVDGLNKARKFNIKKAFDKSLLGYGTIISENYINAYKLAPVYGPIVSYMTDITRKSNSLYGQQFQFISRFYYDDGEKSHWSDYSVVPLPPNQSYLGADKISYENNCIQVQVETGSLIVTDIEIGVKVGDLDFQSVVVLKKSEVGISDNSLYTYNFYNDISLTATDQEKVIKPYSFLPDIPFCQEVTQSAMVYTGGREGWPILNVNATVAVEYEPLYLPDGTENKLNEPLFTSEKREEYGEGSFLDKKYRVTRFKFVIGVDVKKGNVFTLTGKNGANNPFGNNKNGIDNYFWQYTATEADTAATVANRFKSFLRSTHRGRPDKDNGISLEAIDGSGNVSWEYEYLGQYKKSATIFASSVTPVSFDSLKDNGVSINAIKSGSARQYAFGYFDDDGRPSLAFTNSFLEARSASVNERQAAALERPIHTINIYHKPPLKARYWQLLRTKDPVDYIWLLIQKVIDVPTDDSVAYLDLVVGSLFTYQKLHENTILQYTFEKGDRITLIRDTATEVLYPQFETEILSYKDITEENVNASVKIDGTDTVIVGGDGSNEEYVGKSIVINGYERIITGRPDGDKYTIDSPIAGGTTDDPVSYSDYKIIDRRGIIRIRKPDVAIIPEIKDNSLIQISKQIKNTSDNFKKFYAFGKKYEVANFGTDQRSHRGSVQDQTDVQPAIVKVVEGDAYWRNRELPTNNVVPGTQVLIENVEDPNFSDFYQSDLYSLGRAYPKDDGSGEKWFYSRARYSNNYVEDTRINGLNDFDNLDRQDYNDSYGDIKLIRFLENRLFVFKSLRTCWSPVYQTLIKDNRGQEILGTSTKLLNDLQYFSFGGGIGNNPESWVRNDNFQYFASAATGVFLRLSSGGINPISTIYDYDTTGRAILSAVDKYNLDIVGGFDRDHDEVLWSVPAYKEYVFKSGFKQNEWKLVGDGLPEGTVYEIVAQPANSTIELTETGEYSLQAGSVLGDDFFTYKGTLPGGQVVGPRKFCFTVVVNPDRLKKYQTIEPYCVLEESSNTGYQGWKIIKQVYVDDESDAGRQMPNIAKIAAEALVPMSADITYNQTDVVPAGGVDGDIWYNQESDRLYRNYNGSWLLLTNRITNPDYVPPVQNLVACPIQAISCGAGAEYTGGESFPYEQIVILGNDLGNVTLSFDARSVPDKFQVYYPADAETPIIDTGYRGDAGQQTALNDALAARGLPNEPIVGTGEGSESFNKTLTNPTAKVLVWAPIGGTAWDFILGCPE